MNQIQHQTPHALSAALKVGKRRQRVVRTDDWVEGRSWQRIALTKGRFAIIDTSDWDDVVKWNWYLSSMGYAIRDVCLDGNRSIMRMHRCILRAGSKDVCDHINGDSLDNRKSNLRLCTPLQNQMNRRMDKRNKTGFKGVEWRNRYNTFIAKIIINGERKHLGSFKTAEEASEAYKQASLKNHGEFSVFHRSGDNAPKSQSSTRATRREEGDK